MFAWIKNFFSGLFGTKQTQEMTVKALISSQFRGKPIFARKVSGIMSACLSAIETGTVINLSTADAVVDGWVVRYNMTKDERLLLGVIIGNAKAEMTKTVPAITGTAGYHDPAKDIFRWVKETADIYS